MKKVIILTFILLSFQVFPLNYNIEFNTITTSNQELDVDEVGKLIKDKTNSLKKIINKKIQRGLYRVAEDLLVDVVKTASGVYYEKMGKDVVNELYKNLSEDQVDVLNFFLLSRVASELDRKNFLAEEDSLRLELYRDRRDKLYKSLLNIMDKIANVSDSVIKSIK